MLMHTAVIIANRIHKFVEDWVEGESYYLTIPIDELFLAECENLEDKIGEILINISVAEPFKITCDELVLEVDKFVLQSVFDARMDEWTKEKQLNQEDYYGRGAI